MCRIFGYVGKWSSRIAPFVRGLVLAEEARNPHGTGLVVRQKETKLMKKGIRGSAFILRGHADFLNKLDSKDLTALIGHVRYKTAGKQSDANSHPFGFKVKGDWHHGLHNGIIGCADKLKKEFGIAKYAVDSKSFFAAIAKLQNRDKLSTVEAIETVTELISADADFAFLYMTPKEVFMWRNEGRPLAIFDGRKTLLKGRVFCSTAEMFEKAAKLSATSFEERSVSYFEAVPYCLYRLDLSDKKFEIEPVKDLKRKRKPSCTSSIWGNLDDEPFPFLPPDEFDADPDMPEETEEELPAEEIQALADDELIGKIEELEFDLEFSDRKAWTLALLSALYEEYERREQEEYYERDQIEELQRQDARIRLAHGYDNRLRGLSQRDEQLHSTSVINLAVMSPISVVSREDFFLVGQGVYAVPSRAGQRTYQVILNPDDTLTCNCREFRGRQHCYHSINLARFLVYERELEIIEGRQ